MPLEGGQVGRNVTRRERITFVQRSSFRNGHTPAPPAAIGYLRQHRQTAQLQQQFAQTIAFFQIYIHKLESHGLRAGELVTLRWDAIDFAHGRLHVSRLKGSSESVHPLSGRELRALRRLKREQQPVSPFIFTSERGAPFTPAGFRKMAARLGVAAGGGPGFPGGGAAD